MTTEEKRKLRDEAIYRADLINKLVWSGKPMDHKLVEQAARLTVAISRYVNA